MLRRMAQKATRLISQLKMPSLIDLLNVLRVLVGRWRVMHAIKNSALVARVGGQSKTLNPLRTISIPRQEKEVGLDQKEGDLWVAVSGQGRANVSPPEVVNNSKYLYLASLVCVIFRFPSDKG